VTLNRYVYANNNPVNLVDPLGREAGSPTKYQLGVCEWCKPTGGAGGGAVVVVYRGGITPGQVALAGVGALALYSVVLTADEALNLVLEAQGDEGAALEPPSDWPLPPGWTEEWIIGPGSRARNPVSWYDPEGGEWRWHPPDEYHPEFPEGHWDYRPPSPWNAEWQRAAP
jgi:hypothetical protein